MTDRVHGQGLRAALAFRHNVVPLHGLPKLPAAESAAYVSRLTSPHSLGFCQSNYSFHATAHASIDVGAARSLSKVKCPPEMFT